MTENENKLIVVKRSLATLADSPVVQVEVAKQVNSKLNEVFEVERFLNELNIRLFEGKGEVIPVYQQTNVKPEVGQNQDIKQQSRFKKLFTLDYQPEKSALSSELRIKKQFLPNELKVDHLESVGIKVYQEVYIQEEVVYSHILGKLYFYTPRSSGGRWNNSPTSLKMQSQGRALSFSLRAIPPADEVKVAFWKNIREILSDLTDGNFIPPLEADDSNITADRVSDLV
ncbi:MAG: hypothetical protein ABH819_03135 [Patescibacteria group bacterium]